jgi:putative ubiquitin-RnfH superfamily antitoxin RatB of RatAB toxin-antitoxin module
MAELRMLKIQVCYALPEDSFIAELSLPEGATLAQAVRESGVLQRYPSIDLDTQKLGIFGKIKPPDTLLREGDRVEMYRPLQADPMETRRRRAKHRAASTGR